MNKQIPKFKSEDEEREFYASRDSTEYVDWKKAKRVVLPELEPSLKTISLRLPVHSLLNSSAVSPACLINFLRMPGPSSGCCGMDRVYS